MGISVYHKPKRTPDHNGICVITGDPNNPVIPFNTIEECREWFHHVHGETANFREFCTRQAEIWMEIRRRHMEEQAQQLGSTG